MKATQNHPTPPSAGRRKNSRRAAEAARTARARPLAYGYVRVSTMDQAERGASMAAQRRALRGYADAHDWDIEFVPEAGISAKNMNRPVLQDALARLDAGEADFLVATALDRISRSVIDAANLMQRSLSHGWGIATIREAFDPTTAVGRLFVNIVIAIAAFEREVTGERTKEGMAQRKLEGSVFGKPSQLDPAVRARINAQFAAGVTCTQIARELAAEGVPTAHGGSWRAGTVRYLVLAADAKAA